MSQENNYSRTESTLIVTQKKNVSFSSDMMHPALEIGFNKMHDILIVIEGIIICVERHPQI